MTDTIHFVPVAETGSGPRTYAEWILRDGWFRLYETKIEPYLEQCDGICLWLPLGRDEHNNGVIEYGGLDSLAETEDGKFSRHIGSLNCADSRVGDLAEALPAFIDFLAGERDTYVYAGSLINDAWGNYLYGNAPDLYRRWLWRNTSIYRGARLILDKCAAFPADRREDLARIRRQTGYSASLEGRRLREYPLVNTEKVGCAWEARSRFNADVHFNDNEIKGKKFAMLTHAPEGLNKREWQQAQIAMTPEDTDIIINVSELP